MYTVRLAVSPFWWIFLWAAMSDPNSVNTGGRKYKLESPIMLADSCWYFPPAFHVPARPSVKLLGANKIREKSETCLPVCLCWIPLFRHACACVGGGGIFSHLLSVFHTPPPPQLLPYVCELHPMNPKLSFSHEFSPTVFNFLVCTCCQPVLTCTQ